MAFSMIMMMTLQAPEEREEFLEYYNEYKGLMYKVAYRILGNQHDAEDAVSQAFMAVLDNFEKYSKKLHGKCPKTKAFFVTIVEHKSIDIIRERMPLSEVDSLEEAYGIPAPIEEDSPLGAALNSISQRYREYLLLRYDMEYSIDEMSKLLGESYDSVRKTVYRAKQALEKAFNEVREDSHEQRNDN